MVSQITPEELVERLDGEDTFTLVDTRPEESYESWHIAEANNLPFPPGDELDEEQRARVDELSNGHEIVAICGKGISSTSFATELDDHGYEDVTVVKGGMEDWSKVYDVVSIETPTDTLTVFQIQRRAKGCLGYVVGSRRTGEAVAVDVTRQTGVVEGVAQEAGLTITRVIDTHIHADHLSGGRELADKLGVPYHLSGHVDDRDVTVEREYDAVEDGDLLTVGDIDLDVLHTPGHTSEMVNLVVDGSVVLTSDTLFVDGVGRTELQFGEEDAAYGAELLYESVNDILADLDNDLTVLPGHVGVTADGRYETGHPGEPIAARLGDLKTHLDVFTHNEAEFVSDLSTQNSEKPQNYETIIAVNTGNETVDREEDATELELGPNNCSA